jgi:CelD/BcsL family acetyltransferase involved in cellulose biosynthesis
MSTLDRSVYGTEIGGISCTARLPLDSGRKPGVRIVQSPRELDQCRPIWERLAAGRNSVHGFAYSRAWADGLGSDQQLHVLVAGTGACAAIAPLVINGRNPGWLTFLAAEMYEMLDFLYTGPSALPALAQAIVRTGRPLYLKRVPADSPALAALQSAFRHRGLILKKADVGASWISLDESWTEPESCLNARRKSDMRRARRIAENWGALEVEIARPSCQQLPHLLDEFFCTEAAGWKGAQGTALVLDPVRSAFFRRLATYTLEQGTLRLCFLRIGGRVAAAQIALESGDTFSLLRSGYDEQFARCSPSVLLLLETLRYAAHSGLHFYEFNGGVEPWTRIWTDRERPSCSLRCYPFSPRGTAALIHDFGSIALRKFSRAKHL